MNDCFLIYISSIFIGTCIISAEEKRNTSARGEQARAGQERPRPQKVLAESDFAPPQSSRCGQEG